MIYLFTWNSDFLVSEQVNRWKNQFLEKHWDFNLLHLKDLSLVNNSFLVENLTSASFFNQKKLIIIDWLPLSSIEKSADIKSKQDFIESLLEKIPEENIVLFNTVNPDKRSKFYKKLKSVSEVKEFNLDSEHEIVNIISKKYPNKISNQAINLIIKYKAWNLTKIFSELEKLFILYDFIDTKEIKENIVPELEESIFQFIDDLLNLRIKEALNKLEIILEQTNIYAFYNNLLANLRTQVFIERLKTIPSTSNSPHSVSPKGREVATKLSSKEISEILWLWNRAFLVNKSYKISFDALEKLYIWLVDLDKKMKTWAMIWSEDQVFVSEIEKNILKTTN